MTRYIVEQGSAGWYVKEPSVIGPDVPTHIPALCNREEDARLIAAALEAYPQLKPKRRTHEPEKWTRRKADGRWHAMKPRRIIMRRIAHGRA